MYALTLIVKSISEFLSDLHLPAVYTVYAVSEAVVVDATGAWAVLS